MSRYLKHLVSDNLKVPKEGFFGWLVSTLLKRINIIPEENAARLCDIKPHYRVLEVGHGPGLGLQEAAKYITAGDGMIYGIDISMKMHTQAQKLLKREIREGKVDLTLGNVLQLPYDNDMFDRVFHCNCYYFWPDPPLAASELLRVMKPNSFMVTTLRLDNIKRAKERGFMAYGSPDPVQYMHVLETAGFNNVHIEYLSESRGDYQAIFAHVGQKKIKHKDISDDKNTDNEI